MVACASSDSRDVRGSSPPSVPLPDGLEPPAASTLTAVRNPTNPRKKHVSRLRATRGAVIIGALVVASMCVLPAGGAVAGTTGTLRAQAKGSVRQTAVAGLLSTIAHGTVFVSPSRNIACEVDFQFAHIGAATFCQTLAPPRSVTITATGAIDECSGVSCVGHPAKNTPVLIYMASTATGPFLCASRFDGVACSAAGRAFLISKSGTVTYAVLPHTTMAVYTDPGSHPRLSAAKSFGWVVALDMAGHDAEVLVECGHGLTGNLPRDGLWTVDLSAVTSFEAETNLADPAAGSVVAVARDKWVSSARARGWDGYLDLGSKHSFVSNGPGSFICPDNAAALLGGGCAGDRGMG